MIRACLPSDAKRISEIYNHYVRETVVTFEEQVIEPAMMSERIASIVEMYPYLVWEEGEVLGYAYATAWKPRSAYRLSVESTIYLEPRVHGRGIGTRLYQALISEMRAKGFHCAVGGIALPNPASVALHERLGFTKIGQFHDIGWKFGRWIDVGYWELLL